MKQEELMKSRSYGATISAAYKTFSNNFRLIFRQTWPLALAFALVSPVYVLAGTSPAAVSGAMQAAVVAAGVALLVIEALLYARITALLNGQTLRWNALRWLKLAAGYVVLMLVVMLLIAAVAWGCRATFAIRPDEAAMMQQQELLIAQANAAMMKTVGITMGAALLIGLLLIPLVYAVPRYYMQPAERFLSLVGRGYARGMRHWGYIFTTLLIAMLCLLVFALVVSLPDIIVVTASALSARGQLIMGDESGLPARFAWLAYGVSAITLFIGAYMEVFTLLLGYYIYGSIEQKELERSQLAAEHQPNTAENV